MKTALILIFTFIVASCTNQPAVTQTDVEAKKQSEFTQTTIDVGVVVSDITKSRFLPKNWFQKSIRIQASHFKHANPHIITKTRIEHQNPNIVIKTSYFNSNPNPKSQIQKP